MSEKYQSNNLRYRAESHPQNAQSTPPYLLEPLREILGGIALDPCTEPDNPTRAERFFALPQDGCSEVWEDRTFVNPPYGKAKERWVEKAIQESKSGKRIILLVPARTELKHMQEAFGSCETILFVNGRLQFGKLRECGRREAASHGSMVIGFNVDLSPLSDIGTVVKVCAWLPPKMVKINDWETPN